MPDYPNVVYWLTLINESGLKLNIVKPIVQRWAIIENRSIASLFELSPLEWSTTFGLTDSQAEQVATASNKLAGQAEILAKWQAQGLNLLTRADPNYPIRLVRTLPPDKQPLLLWTQGNLNLLNKPTVTILGESTTATETIPKLIEELLPTLTDAGIVLLSGYSRGLDRTAFEAMLETQGQAVAMLPMGLTAFIKTTTRLENAIKAGQILLVSPFAPDTPFNERYAEARNLLIDSMAFTMVVLNVDENTQARASQALQRELPVFVDITDTALLNQGALLMTATGEVVEMVQQSVIDVILLDPEDEPPVAQPPELPDYHTNAGDDFSLNIEDVGLIEKDEALEILSIGGTIPDILRRRLDNEA